MSDTVGYELLEVSDTSPDRLARQDCGHLRRDFGARQQRSVCFRKRSGEDRKLSSREQDQTAGEKATLGAYLSPHSVGTSCRLQDNLRKDGFTQKQDHVHRQCTSSSSAFHPHQHLCHRSEGLPKEAYMETCSNMLKEDENNRTLIIDELSQTALKEVKRNEKNTISGHSISTPMQKRRKMFVCNSCIFQNGIAADEPMPNKRVKRVREASLRKDGFTQKQDHVHRQFSSSSSEFHPHLCHPSEELPKESYMESISNMLREDENNRTLNFDEISQTALEEVKRNEKNTISGHSICTPLQKRRKILVCNSHISRNGIAADEPMSNESVKRVREATIEGCFTNDESADANSCNLHFQPNNISLPFAAQQEDRRKGRTIVCGDMVERDENNCVQLLQKRKRTRVNSSCSGEVKRFCVCRDGSSPWPRGSSGLDTEDKSQAYRNDDSLNISRDDASERNIKFTCNPQGCSRLHRNERQPTRLDQTRGDLLSLSSVGDQGNSSEAGSPEVVFLGSCRPLQRNSFSTSRPSNVVQESVCNVGVDVRTPIDVDSLEYPINETVNLEERNNETSARARQIERDELSARQLQEEFAGEELKGGLQQDDPISRLTVQREIRELVAASGSDSAPGFSGLRASFGIGARRERSHSSAIHPSLPLFLASRPTVPPNRRDVVSGRWCRTVRPFSGSRFQFPSHMNIGMRVDVFAMEHAVESNVTNRFLAGVQRDFNENDYEMLLALDDEKNDCKGASQRHIERLPTSTVQNDISDEACSVCLEMPKSGEVVRHLLCMHRFHKECIDPWLAKRASCPVCKLSI
ncbi:hypothetical protein SUGI_1120690 [Cryptomeria japonica]|nr:hypothetical protein SUGI_1120690 [Cryptomeria japonica]